MFSSYCNLHPASHKTSIDIRDAWARTGTMWESFAFSGVPSISRLYVCVDLSFDLSGILIVIGLIAGCTLFTGVTGRTKCLVAPASAMASCFVILIIGVWYAVFVFLFFRLLMIVVLLSLSSVVDSSTNILLVLCVVVYNKFTVLFSRFCLSILTDIDPISPNHHPHHCCWCCCCFQVSCWSITQLALISCCARINPFPSLEPYGRFLC